MIILIDFSILIRRSLDKITGIILGDSHAQYGIIPSVLNDYFFNTASPCQDLYINYNILKYFSDKIKNFKNVILVINFYNTHFRTDFTSAKFFCPIFNKYFFVPYKKKYINNFKINKELNDFNQTPCCITPQTVQGYDFPNIFVDNSMVQNIAKKHLHTALDYKNNELIYLDKIINFCTINKLNLTVFFPPLRPDYIKEILAITKSNDLSTLYSPISTILNEQKIKKIDLTMSQNFSFADFGDCHHLNLQGANKFSKQINVYLQKIS